MLIMHLLLACVHAAAASVPECCWITAALGGRAEREDSRLEKTLGLEKVSSSVKWRQLVLPLCRQGAELAFGVWGGPTVGTVDESPP